jgi:hypothetical protein
LPVDFQEEKTRILHAPVHIRDGKNDSWRLAYRPPIVRARGAPPRVDRGAGPALLAASPETVRPPLTGQ